MGESLARRATLRVVKAGESSVAAFATRLDGWFNLLTGLGTSTRDKSMATQFEREPVLTPEELEALFHGDDMAQRIVSAVPDDAFRQGFTVKRDVEENPTEEKEQPTDSPSRMDLDDPKVDPQAEKEKVKPKPTPGPGPDLDVQEAQEDAALLMKELKRLGVQDKVHECMTWGRLFGGACILLGVKGGGDPSTPLKDEDVQGVEFLTVLDRRDLFPNTYYTDPMADKYGEVATYWLQPQGIGFSVVATTIVHETRLIFFRGAMTSRRERERNQGWHHSVLQKLVNILRASNSNWASVVHLMTDFSQAVFKIKGLIDALAEGDSKTLQERMILTDMVRSVARAIVIDAEDEDFKVVERGAVTGVGDLLDRTWIRLAAAARMPVTILMGQAPAGLNATGAMDLRWWYDTVKTSQEMEIKPPLERIIRMVAQGLFPGKDAESWVAEFPSLWQMTPSEEADYRLKVAQTDSIYVKDLVVLPEEIALSRWGTGEFSAETQIDLEARKQMLEAETERAIDEALNPPPPPMLPPGADPNAPPKPGDPKAPPKVPPKPAGE